MIRRLLPTVLALGLGFIALVVGLVGLHRIFLNEREGARTELAARRRALEFYAQQSLTQQLQEQLSVAQEQIDLAAEDPLLPDHRLFLLEQGEQRLPRRFRFASAETGVRSLHQSLLAVGPVPPASDEPWIERERMYRLFQQAVLAKDRPRIESSFRALLTHRAQYRLADRQEVPFTLALLEFFTAHSEPHGTLLQSLLREGVPGPRGAHLEGLQRHLLRARSSFHEEEFLFFCQRVEALSHVAGVPTEDFHLRCEDESAPPLSPGDITHPVLWNQSWLLVPFPRGVRGVRAEWPLLLGQVEAQMKSSGLLESADRLVAPPWPGTVELSQLTLLVDSPQWAATEALISRRFHYKTGLAVACGLLGLMLLGLAVMLQHRKQQFLQLKSDFVATVSHELRTPLASVRLMAETLERRLEGHSAAKNYPQRIVEEVVEAIGEEVSHHRGAAVELRREGLTGLVLNGDRDLLPLMLQNLIRNACRYNTRDPIRLCVRAREESRHQVLEVEDNGIGIDPSEWERVFEEFHRGAQATRSGGGSGLGLAICRRVMALHGGSIHITRSTPDGTVFQLRFPRGAMEKPLGRSTPSGDGLP